jgi:outer membrane receptor protein involved in Fe transport
MGFDSFSQNQEVQGGGCYGTVTESAGNMAVEYANITAYLAKDSSLITGTITDVSGRFLLQELPLDKIWLEIEFVGFEKVKTETFVLDDKNPYKAFENIVISPAVNMLGEVSVEAEVKHVEYQIDKKIVNPTKDIISAGGSAVDVLKNVPSIQTDIDGNVSLRGSSDFKLLIDGRPSVIGGSEGLKQIPAEAIERIEVITNPSARYDAEGVAGIINVILKTEKRNGINGMLSLSGGQILDEFNTSNSFIVNFRKDKVNFFLGGNYNIFNWPGSGHTNQITTGGDSIVQILSDFTSLWQNNSYNFRGGGDYYFANKDVLTLSFNVGEWSYGGNNNSTNTFTAKDSLLTRSNSYSFDQFTDFSIINNYYAGTVNYQHKFKKEAHELSLSASINSGFETKDTRYTVNYSDIFLNNNPISKFGNYTYEENDNSRAELELNYINPIFGGKLEAGYKMSIFDVVGTYDFYNILNPEHDSIVIDSLQINPLTSFENIQSIYSTFEGSLLKFGYKIGLRMEYTDRVYTKRLTGFEFGNKDISLFPSVHISRSINDKNQFFASYSRRINRPYSWYLDPQIIVTGLFSSQIGNPELKPEFTGSYDLGYILMTGKHYFSVEAFYRQTNNKISSVFYMTDSLGLNTVTTFSNIDKDYSSGLEAMASLNFGPFSFATGGSFYNYTLIGQYNGATINRNAFNYNLWLNTSVVYKKTGTKFQINGYFSGPEVDAYSSADPYYSLSAAVKQDFLKNKLSITLSCDNLLYKKDYITETVQNNFYSESIYHISGFRFRLSLVYRINDYKPREESENPESEQGGGMKMM